MIAMITAEARAAAAPCRKRAPTRAPPLGAMPHSIEAATKASHADQEDALAPEEIAEAAGEQQQAPEGDQVAVDDPGQARLAEVQVRLDGGEGDVDDRRVEDDHQLAQADDEERDPPAAVGLRALW